MRTLQKKKTHTNTENVTEEGNSKQVLGSNPPNLKPVGRGVFLTKVAKKVEPKLPWFFSLTKVPFSLLL